MKKVQGLLACCLIVGVIDARAQTEKGSWEISAAANAGSMSRSYESSSGGYSTSGSSDALMYFALDLRAGWYVVDGFSIEPEVYMFAAEEQEPAFNFGGNLSYTFNIQESPVKPFLIAGYGIGNAIPIAQLLLGQSSDELDIPVLRVGGGLKVFVSKNVALKAEYRYERYTSEESSSSYYGSYSSTTVTNFHNILFGFCVFFPLGG